MAIKKDDYYKYTNLYVRHRWLHSKKEQLKDLIDFCEDRESKDLVFSLLERFNYINTDSLNILLNDIADHIINETGFNEAQVQVLAMSWDDEADSGQKILDYIKMPLFQKGWRIKTVNIFGASIKNYNKGKNQILLVDEFVGSGKTLRSRLNYLKKNIPGEYEVKCCFVAGMKNTIDALTNEGIDLFCPLQLERGVTDFFNGIELSKAESIMLELELKLSQTINDKSLFDYSFGYGGAEALYSLEGANGNTPNSVFPIFWWLKDKDDRVRNTLLTRYENGF
jgi:hypothetical protein